MRLLEPLPAWPQTLADARLVQETLRHRVDLQTPLPPLMSIGGVDVSNSPGRAPVYAAAVRLDAATLAVEEVAGATGLPAFPYVPGFLSFRETPVVWAALQQLASLPDVLIVDGHGIAHPRRFGIACHLGVLLDRPTIGCAKRILVGKHAPLAETAGACTPLLHSDELLGYVLRTRTGVQPVYVSPGHRVSAAEAVEVVWRCVRRHRLPEPPRQAHLAANRVRLQAETA